MEERKFWIVVAVVLLAGFIFKLRWFIWPLDFATSVIPGWHTTIYPPFYWVRAGLFFSFCLAAVIFLYIRYNKPGK